MKKLKNILYILVFASVCISCNKEYLDVASELAEERDMEKIFSNPADVKAWHRNIYSGIPSTEQWDQIGGEGLANPWPQLSDEIKIRQSTDWNLLEYTPGYIRQSRWSLYQQIRQANIFLERAVEIPMSGDSDFIKAEEIEEMKVQARFLRAYYHYLLFELYGPIPIMVEVADPQRKDLDYARNSVDEVVNFIYDELTATANGLKDPNYSDQLRLAIPTKGTALAVRARLMMYAASPLYNGEWALGMSLRNVDGKQLFPAKDPSKWDRALSALQEFIDYAEAGHYELYKEYTNGVLDPHKSLYELFMKYNREIIFARSGTSWGSVPNSGVEGRSVPRGARGGSTSTGGIALTQELVDDFFMIDGLSIEESPLYSEEGFSTPGEDLSGQAEPGTYRMYINREPRFYQSVFYNGRRWHVGNEQIWFNKGGNSDNSAGTFARTGYIAYKRLSKKVYNEGNHPRSEYRPAIIHRLAEFYLLYAEALNEVSPGDPRIIEYIDKVRERAGVPLLADIKPEIMGNQAAQREAVRAEMRVELNTEGQRYFDVRRWLIADNPSGEGAQGGPFYGMNLNSMTLEGFYERTVIETRAWTDAMYLYPITLRDVQTSSLLVQNPGY